MKRHNKVWKNLRELPCPLPLYKQSWTHSWNLLCLLTRKFHWASMSRVGIHLQWMVKSLATWLNKPTRPLPRAGLAQSPYPIITWSGLPGWPVQGLSRGPPLVTSIMTAIVQWFKQLVNNNNISITWEIPRVSVALYQEPRTKKKPNKFFIIQQRVILSSLH